MMVTFLINYSGRRVNINVDSYWTPGLIIVFKDIYAKSVDFFNKAEIDGDKKISPIEFFIQLPKLEAFLINKKL